MQLCRVCSADCKQAIESLRLLPRCCWSSRFSTTSMALVTVDSLTREMIKKLQGWPTTSWLPYSTYLYLDFHLFHDKAKRTQQGDLLGTPPPFNGKNPLSSFWKVPLSSCIRYSQISKWEKYTKVMLSGTCFMSFTNYPLDEQLCRVLSVSHSNSIHEVEIGHILLLLWEEIKGTHSACCRLCCGARYRTTQSSNGPCSTSLSSDTSRTTTRLWSWRTQCILYRYICTTSLIGARLLRRY